MDAGYEYAVPVTIGGPAATYTLTSPWNGPAEYCTRMVSFTGAGGVALTYDDTRPAVTTTTATNTTGGQPGELFYTSAAGTLAPAALFALCPTGRLTLTITGASNVLVTIHWRRRLEFANIGDFYHINPDTTPEEAVAAARAIDAQKHKVG